MCLKIHSGESQGRGEGAGRPHSTTLWARSTHREPHAGADSESLAEMTDRDPETGTPPNCDTMPWAGGGAHRSPGLSSRHLTFLLLLSKLGQLGKHEGPFLLRSDVPSSSQGARVVVRAHSLPRMMWWLHFHPNSVTAG